MMMEIKKVLIDFRQEVVDIIVNPTNKKKL